MTPALSSTGRAAAFAVFLLFLLTLPVTLWWGGHVSVEQAYRGISERAGPFDRVRRQIFEEHTDLDIAMCGTSLLRAAMDVGYVQREFSRALGRDAQVVLVPQSWQGPDMNYYVARDLLENRKVKVLVIAAPAWVQRSSQPHVQLFRVIRYGDHPGALDGLPLRYRMGIYADYVLGAPRQALSLLRPNLVDPKAGFEVDHATKIGYLGGPFVPHEVTPAPIPPDSIIYSAATQDVFRFDGPPLNTYQLHFLRKTVELARQHGALLVILHMPSPSERGSALVPDRRLTPGLLGPGVVFAGIPWDRMFAGVPDAEALDFFQDEHLNLNGAALYSKLITPTLIQLYEHYTQAR